jgi:hypothetical protein
LRIQPTSDLVPGWGRHDNLGPDENKKAGGRSHPTTQSRIFSTALGNVAQSDVPEVGCYEESKVVCTAPSLVPERSAFQKIASSGRF